MHTDILCLPPAARATLIALSVLSGMCMGSFLFCVSIRSICAGERRGYRSRCPLCGHTLSPRELVPVMSYVVQRGRCRSCAGRIPLAYPISEIVCGAMYAACVLRFGLSFEALGAAAFGSVLFCCAVTDLAGGVLPDRFHAAGILCWVVSLPLVAYERGGVFWDEMRGMFAGGMVGALGISLPLAAVVLFMNRALKREGMGMGDIKLLSVTGLYLGFGMALTGLILSCIFGIVFGLVYRGCGGKTGKPGEPGAVVTGGRTVFPFAPAVSAAAFLTLLFGLNLTG